VLEDLSVEALPTDLSEDLSLIPAVKALLSVSLRVSCEPRLGFPVLGPQINVRPIQAQP
jgi:hypothetical protein